jgi:carbon storage regulator
MLVLSRKRNEGLVFGDEGDIVLTVVEIRGDKVRLGIQADKEKVPVHRMEVWVAIHGGPWPDGQGDASTAVPEGKPPPDDRREGQATS